MINYKILFIICFIAIKSYSLNSQNYINLGDSIVSLIDYSNKFKVNECYFIEAREYYKNAKMIGDIKNEYSLNFKFGNLFLLFAEYLKSNRCDSTIPYNEMVSCKVKTLSTYEKYLKKAISFYSLCLKASQKDSISDSSKKAIYKICYSFTQIDSEFIHILINPPIQKGLTEDEIEAYKIGLDGISISDIEEITFYACKYCDSVMIFNNLKNEIYDSIINNCKNKISYSKRKFKK